MSDFTYLISQQHMCLPRQMTLQKLNLVQLLTGAPWVGTCTLHCLTDLIQMNERAAFFIFFPCSAKVDLNTFLCLVWQQWSLCYVGHMDG